MKDLVKNNSSENLREALTQRLELEKVMEREEGAVGRATMLKFLKNKKYLIEDHINPCIKELYEVDINYLPTIKEGKWITIKMISKVRLRYSSAELESERYNDEIRIDSNIVYTKYDDFKPEFGDDEGKYKHFHPNFLKDLEETTKAIYDDLVNAWEVKEDLIKTQINSIKNNLS